VVAGISGCKIAVGTLKRFSADIHLWSTKFSSEEPRWQTLPEEGWPAMTCLGPEAEVSDCCDLPATRPQVDCQEVASECDADLNQCVLYFVYQEVATVDLMKEVPSLEEHQEELPRQVLLQSVTSSTTCDFEWPLPSVNMYVAPGTVKSAADPQAVYLATIPPRDSTVLLAESAQHAFSDIAVDYHTPFNLIFATTITVTSGPRPQGRLAIDVSGRIEAAF